MTGETMRVAARYICLAAGLGMLGASLQHALAGDFATAMYDGILALVGFLAYTMIRLGDLFDMLELWREDAEQYLYEQWDDEEELQR